MHDIKTELDQAQQSPKRTVKAWLDEAEALKERSDSIGVEYETYQQHKNCIGCCPKCLHRYRISKDVRECNRNVSELLSKRAQSDFPSSGQYGDPTPHTQIPIPISETCNVAEAKQSEQRDFVVRLLTDSSIQRIGIIGMGGVGKTRLLDTINNSEKVKTSFQLIIKLTVSRNDIALQKCVAERLSLGQLPDYPEGRIDKLRKGLKNRRYVLLLDDMWAADAWTTDRLQDLGVSLEDKTWKFVLTTRDEEVCAKMNVHIHERILVKPLLEEQGWQLFRRRAFGNEDGNEVPQDIEPVARRFAQECKGLPLAINVVAAAVSHHTTLKEWDDALKQMQSVSESFYELHSGVDEQLFKRLKWSYDVLPHRLQTCFLYFAAYPEDEEIRVSNVIEMWTCEGLVVEETEDSYFHDIGQSVIKHLAGRSLIEVVSHGYGGRIERVKIHDILRDLAIRIAAKKEQKWCFKAGQSLKSFDFEEVISKDCVKLSLMRSDLRCLPTTFPCRSLSVLLLNQNSGIEEVPERFLSDLSSLKVLDLSETRITSLPPSIGNLKHLVSLQLQKSDIHDLPEAIGDLKELQFLNVSGCHQLQCLPQRITELKRLRVLGIEVCWELRHLPRGIKELISLEILEMWGNSIELDFEKDANAEGASACLKDLQTLRRLRVFSAKIKSPVKEGVMANWLNMRELRLEFVGGDGHNYLPQDMQVMKDMESFTLTNCDVERVPHFPKLEYLDVDACRCMKELPTEIPCLTHLTIQRCDKLEELELGKGFPKLEYLILYNLKSLECVGPVGAASGGLGEGASPLPPMLKSLQVVRCPKLKRLRGGWDKLNHLVVISCEREWWDEILQWGDPNMKTLLENKCEFGEWRFVFD